MLVPPRAPFSRHRPSTGRVGRTRARAAWVIIVGAVLSSMSHAPLGVRPAAADADAPPASAELQTLSEAERTELRAELFLALKVAPSESAARRVEDRIWRLWIVGPTPEITEQIAAAMERRRWHDYAGALEILNGVVETAPGYAEGWNQRAFIHFLREDYDKSLDDIVRVLELEPNHFGALAGRFRIFLLQGRSELAVSTLRRAVDIHPYLQERAMLPPALQETLPPPPEAPRPPGAIDL